MAGSKECLEVDPLAHVIFVSSGDRCQGRKTSRTLWRWHPKNTRLLQNIEDGNCLTSSFDIEDVIRSSSPVEVGMKFCSVVDTNRRQVGGFGGILRYLKVFSRCGNVLEVIQELY